MSRKRVVPLVWVMFAHVCSSLLLFTVALWHDVAPREAVRGRLHFASGAGRFCVDAVVDHDAVRAAEPLAVYTL